MELEVIRVLLTVVGALLSILVLVIGWIGTKIHGRLDSISMTLAAIEKDLRKDLSHLDRRLTRVEARYPNENCSFAETD